MSCLSVLMFVTSKNHFLKSSAKVVGFLGMCKPFKTFYYSTRTYVADRMQGSRV